MDNKYPTLHIVLTNPDGSEDKWELRWELFDCLSVAIDNDMRQRTRALANPDGWQPDHEVTDWFTRLQALFGKIEVYKNTAFNIYNDEERRQLMNRISRGGHSDTANEA